MTSICSPAARICLVIAMLATIGGCCWRHRCVNPSSGCDPVPFTRAPITGSAKTDDAGAIADFSKVTSSARRESLIAQIAQPTPVWLDLRETTCLAATNDRLANLIENERRAIGCRRGTDGSAGCGSTSALDAWLAGQTDEQRNRAAADAAEVFLRLVEVTLQRKLLLESADVIQARDDALDRAAESGFATAEARFDLEQTKLELETSNSELTTREQQLQYQLNLLLGGDATSPVLVAPVYELLPEEPAFDVAAEMEAAANRRPGIVGAERALSSGASPGDLASWLMAFDRSLGIRTVQIIVKRWLNRHPPTDGRDGAIRKEQVRQALDILRDTARSEAAKAMLDADAAWDQLDLVNAELEQLNKRRRQLERQQEVSGERQSKLLAENWAAIQRASSRRVTLAIDLEIARIRLLAAQGRLSKCGEALEQTAAGENTMAPPQ